MATAKSSKKKEMKHKSSAASKPSKVDQSMKQGSKTSKTSSEEEATWEE